MSDFLKDVGALIRGNAEAGRVVPPQGVSVWLVAFTAAAMTFLAAVALAFSFSANRIANAWADELASSLTIRVSAPIEQMSIQTEATLEVLRTTPGISSAKVITNEEQAALLEPWLGTSVDIERFSLPTLIAVEETATGPDRSGLRLRLEAEAPGAEIDDHGRWREPMINSAKKIRNIGTFVVLLVLAALIATILLAVQAAIVSNSGNISTLRLIGARDSFVVRAFVRQITLRALAGAVAGAIVAVIVIAIQSGDADSTVTFGYQGREWIAPVLLVPVVGIIAFFATRTSSFSALRKLD